MFLHGFSPVDNFQQLPARGCDQPLATQSLVLSLLICAPQPQSLTGPVRSAGGKEQYGAQKDNGGSRSHNFFRHNAFFLGGRLLLLPARKEYNVRPFLSIHFFDCGRIFWPIQPVARIGCSRYSAERGKGVAAAQEKNLRLDSIML
jgi:hypothetical protein